MIHLPNDFPGLAVIVDVPAPGQRLEADTQTARGGAFAEFMEVRDDPATIAERLGRDIRAHQHEVRAQFLQQVEFALGAIEHAGAQVRRHSFEIAKWLERHAGEAEVAHHRANHGN